MNQLPLSVGEITQRHDEWTSRWHESSTPPQTDPLWIAIEQNHRMNYEVWHEEDMVRRDDISPERVCEAKRATHRCNQARNDAMEQMDLWLLSQLPPANPGSALHSETPGMIIDRLSILSIKLYHMRIEARRESAEEGQRRKCAARCAILEEQAHDLKNCLEILLMEFQKGTRHFKLYRQFKMYNDTSLNPQLYGRVKHLNEDAPLTLTPHGSGARK